MQNHVTKTWLYGTSLYYFWFSQHNDFGSVREYVEYWQLSYCFGVPTCSKILIISFEITLPSILSVLERTADPPTQSCIYSGLFRVHKLDWEKFVLLVNVSDTGWRINAPPYFLGFDNCSTIFLRAFADFPHISMQLCSCLKNVSPVSFITFWWVEIEVGSTENQMIRGCITTASYPTPNPISFHLASAL